MMDFPLVDPLDDGIRPAGPPDACFYCQQPVGRPHGPECVMVTRIVEMAVVGGEFRGIWTLRVPYFWTAEDCEFQKNYSSWCADNLLREQDSGSVVWHVGSWEILEKARDSSANGCLCGMLDFTFLQTVDATPKRRLRGGSR